MMRHYKESKKREKKEGEGGRCLASRSIQTAVDSKKNTHTHTTTAQRKKRW